MMKKIILTILFLNLTLFGLSAGVGINDRWISYTSTSQVRFMDYFDDSLQVMTSGGWLKIDPNTQGMRKITKTDGLGTNDLYFILKDNSSNVWLAGYGELIKYNNGQYTPFLFFDRDNNLLTLYSIADDDSNLWVGTSSGLALFSKAIDGGQIQDFYSRFGNFNPNPAVNDLLILGDTIWIATNSGLAVADKSNPDLLKSYLNWETFTTAKFPELQSDIVTALAYYHNKFYVGATRGAFRMEISGSDTSFIRVPTRNNISVEHMIIEGDSLIIYASGGFFIHTESGTTWNNTPTLPDYNFSCGRYIDDVHWIGQQSKGIYYGAGADYSKFPDGGLPDNRVTAFSSNSDGRVVGCFYNKDVAQFDSSGWKPIFSQVGEWATSSVQDDSGGIWIGTWGGGAAVVKPETTIIFKENNSSLHGVSENPSYVVAFHMAMADHFLFITNYAARDGNGVCVVDLNDISRWSSFGSEDGIPIFLLNSVDCFNDWFAVATADRGIYYYDFGPDPFDKSDDSIVNLREDNSWLGSNTVNVVRFDNEGTLWAGTKFGLSRYDPGIERFVNVILPHGFGPEVTALEFDRRGNIWIGAYNGLARYDASSHSVEVFNILNSGLSDNRINALLINPVTNDLWAGTYSGISILPSDIGRPTRDIKQVIAFPNPFIIRGDGDLLSLNYDGVATVRFYTSAGELVREISANVPWNGKNQHGAEVASGVYLFLITAVDGSTGRGKIFLVRQ